MRLSMMAMTLALIPGSGIRHAWSQHEGHGGGMGPMPMSDPATDARWEAEHRRNKLTKLQDKIDGVEKQLEDAALSPKKRASLEKKLTKLYEQKDRLLGEARGGDNHTTALVHKRPDEETCGQGTNCENDKQTTYACPMGDYQGPATKDGKCPKCGMMLRRQEAADPMAAAQGQAADRSPSQQAVYACPMGDYHGPMTQDGRCPKCGMTLQKK